MKKINILYFVLISLLPFFNFAFGQGIVGVDPCLGQILSSCCCPSNWATSSSCQDGGYGPTSCNQGGNSSNCPSENVYQSGGRTFCCEYPLENGVCLNCPSNRTYTSNGQILCCPGVVDENGDCQAGLSDVGIDINTDCLLNGQCGLNVYKVLGIRKSNENPTVMGLFQDITLASTTAILGTVIIVVIIISGLMFAFASITGKDTKRAKTILIDAFVGLLLVMGSYTIIRLIQFLATAGS